MSFLTGARILFGVLFALVTYLTVTPNPDDMNAGVDFFKWLADLILGNEKLADKIAHFAAYGALGASAALARIKVGGRGAFAVAGLAAYGALLEGVQGLGGVRDPELADAFANAMGAVAGYPLLAILIEHTRNKARA